jgi:hypothetical protein
MKISNVSPETARTIDLSAVSTPLTDRLARGLGDIPSQAAVQAALSLARRFERALRHIEIVNGNRVGMHPRQGRTVLIVRQAIDPSMTPSGVLPEAGKTPATEADIYHYPGKGAAR